MCEGFKLKAQFFVLSFVFLANCADEQRSSANCCLLQCARLSNCMKQKAPRYWVLDCIWNVMAHRRLHLKCDGTCAETRFGLSAKRTSPFKSAGCQFSRLLAVEQCASAVVMLDTPCFHVASRVLATYSILQFPLHFPSRASPCTITFQLDSNLCVSTAYVL